MERTPCTGPRRLDPHQARKVQEKTLNLYRLAAQPFAEWLLQCSLAPVAPEEWDDCLVEFKNEADLSQAKFTQLVSSIELFFPRFKGKLGWSHAVLAGMAISHTPKHTVPCGRLHCRFLGAHFCAQGHPRMGLGMAVQQATGMRPSELLGLFPDHLLFSDETGETAKLHLVIRLGARKGTKAKREQFVILHASSEPELFHLLRRVRDATPQGCPLFPYSLDAYRKLIRKVESSLKLSVGWGPHSPRAGFATDCVAAGVAFGEIQERGRWLSPASLRTYIDVITAVAVHSQIQTSNLREAVLFTNSRFAEYFPEGCFVWQHAAKRQQERPGRQISDHVEEATGGLAISIAAGPQAARTRRVRFE